MALVDMELAWVCAICCAAFAILLSRRRTTDSRCKRVVFVHPDLGLGGAERLVVDMALALQARGYAVVIYTSFHDPSRCFDETRDGSVEVVVRGDWIPRTICGRGHIFCAVARGLALACSLIWLETTSGRGARVAVVDQLSTPVPLLRLAGLRVAFYCHFPDKLLVQARAPSLCQRAYRAPFDLLEELTTGCAHAVVVNSAFTRAVYARAFPLLRRLRAPPAVLHPCVNVERQQPLSLPSAADGVVRFLSLNRYERKKNVSLALRALAALPSAQRARVRLAIAGGYDSRVAENVAHLDELRALAAELGVASLVSFHRSVSDAQRQALLGEAVAVVYTPTDEHFGIVPLEAMAAARAVIAVNSGGPLETVVDGATGFLCEPTARAMAAAMGALVDDPALATRMGRAGREHVCAHFANAPFGARLQALVERVLA